jgi:O-antigen/teichoic acid export membrane protein
VSTTQDPPGIAPPAVDVPARVDETGVELKRGAFLNTIAMLASNFRGIFTFLVARLLGPAALGIFSVAWSTTDIISKLGVFGLDNAITTFIARADATGDHARGRMFFRLAVLLAVLLSAVIALLSIVLVQFLGERWDLQRDMIFALSVIFCALPGIALYRVSTNVSRGMKVMKHDIYSRGITESFATAIGFATFAPELAVIIGTAASGVVAFALASKLFRHVPAAREVGLHRSEARQLLAYAAPISGYQLLNTLISRLDIIILGCFIGRAPGVTLATVGVYGAAIDLANGLRKVNQAFNPIFGPVVAGMTATGDHERAAETYARLAQWMLWILLPFGAVMVLAGSTILLIIFGSAFAQGGTWLAIAAVGAAINAFVSLGETVIMVQRPNLNLLNSSIACAVAVGGSLWLIPRFGATGAAFGVLLPQIVQGILRHLALRLVFRWKTSWSNIRPPIITGIVALVPAITCRLLLDGIAGQLAAAIVFLAVFGLGWKYHARSGS